VNGTCDDNFVVSVSDRSKAGVDSLQAFREINSSGANSEILKRLQWFFDFHYEMRFADCFAISVSIISPVTNIEKQTPMPVARVISVNRKTAFVRING